MEALRALHAAVLTRCVPEGQLHCIGHCAAGARRGPSVSGPPSAFVPPSVQGETSPPPRECAVSLWALALPLLLLVIVPQFGSPVFTLMFTVARSGLWERGG